MTRSSIKPKTQDSSLMSSAHTLSHIKNDENLENLEEILTSDLISGKTANVTHKQTLVECVNNTDNIINVNDLSDVKEIFDKMSFDKMTNDILLAKANPQALASLKEKEKRRTVKELMSKFENK